MPMRLKSQDEILIPEVRKQIIEDIEGPENRRRKDEAYRRWQIYKDKTPMFVINLLLQQFSEETVREMAYSITNISLTRKIINKLARVYVNGVNRTVADGNSEQDTDTIQELSNELNANERLKRCNRILKLEKNAAMYVKPCPFIDNDGIMKHRIRLSPLIPYLYDVVEEEFDRENAMVHILSNYSPANFMFTSRDPAAVRFHNLGLRSATSGLSLQSQNTAVGGDNKDQKIADKKEDEDMDPKTYIWWTDRYHFTTNEKGEIVDENGLPVLDVQITETQVDERLLNPIEVSPVIDINVDQDGSFWAEGGEDLADSSIVVNSLFTQYNHIGVVQGYGQAVVTGKDLPQNLTAGPNRVIKLEHEDGEPVPTFGFANASPPLSELRQGIEAQVALALTTNDLSTNGVSAQLGSSTNVASGVALVIDKAESMEDVEDQRQMFVDVEKEMWPIISKWMQVFSEDGTLDPELEGMTLPEDVDVALEFPSSQALQTETEKLANIEKRKDIGLNTAAELVMIDNPGMTEEEAEAKIAKIEEEKKARMDAFMGDQMDPEEENSEEQGQEEPDEEEEEDAGDGEEDESNE